MNPASRGYNDKDCITVLISNVGSGVISISLKITVKVFLD